MTSTNLYSISVEKCHRLHTSDLEAFAATHVLARQHVFATHHVGACLGKLRPIAFVGAAGQLPLLRADHPPDVRFVLLPTVRAGQRGFLGLLSLVVEVALVHRYPPVDIIPQDWVSTALVPR